MFGPWARFSTATTREKEKKKREEFVIFEIE